LAAVEEAVAPEIGEQTEPREAGRKTTVLQRLTLVWVCKGQTAEPDYLAMVVAEAEVLVVSQTMLQPMLGATVAQALQRQ
jgi:hypothetical protein